MNIYAGNLSNNVTEEDLQAAFESFGKVDEVKLIMDRFSGQSRGFAFIEMSSNDEAKAAIEGLNGKELKGRNIRVNEAIPRDNDRGGHGGHRGGGRGRNNDRGGGGNRGGNRGGGGYGKRW